jgi:glycine oxidase
VIGEESLVAALSVVPEGMQVPRARWWRAHRRRVRKELTGDVGGLGARQREHYVELSRSIWRRTWDGRARHEREPAGADVVVIGGGVIGCAVGARTGTRGLDVSLIERDSPGRRATWAAAGMLSPLGEAGGRRSVPRAGRMRACERYAFRSRAARGDVDRRRVPDQRQAARVAGRSRRRGRCDGSRRTPRQRASTCRCWMATARAASSRAVARHHVGAARRRDHRVNNRLLAQALLASATAAGVRFRTATPVSSVAVKAGTVTGVRLMSGEHVAAPHVVLAAGRGAAWWKGCRRRCRSGP